MTDSVTPKLLLELFHQAAHLAMRELHRNGSHAQGRILDILAAQGNLGQKALLEQLHIRPASLSELLTKLEKNGHIVRQRDTRDKRSIVVELTEQGHAAVVEANMKLQSNIRELFVPLGEHERMELACLLNTLIAAWTKAERSNPAE